MKLEILLNSMSFDPPIVFPRCCRLTAESIQEKRQLARLFKLCSEYGIIAKVPNAGTDGFLPFRSDWLDILLPDESIEEVKNK